MVILTVAPVAWVSSASVSIRAEDSVTGLAPSVKLALPAVITGASCIGVRLMVLVAVPVAAPATSEFASVRL